MKQLGCNLRKELIEPILWCKLKITGIISKLTRRYKMCEEETVVFRRDYVKNTIAASD